MKYLAAVLSCACFSLAQAGDKQDPHPPSSRHASIAVGRIPLSFEPNGGQTDPRVAFLARGSGYTLFLSPSSATFSLMRDANDPARSTDRESVIRMNIVGAQERAHMSGENRLPGIANYLFDHGAGAPITGLPTFAMTRVAQIYPAVDLSYYGTDGRLEYDFVVAPQADPRQIQLGFEGATPAIAADGNLVLQQRGSDAKHAVHLQKPVVYQDIDGRHVPVQGNFALAANRTVRFEVGPYDHAHALIIDPVFTYASYLGGSSQQSTPNGMAVNAAGEIYVTGVTNAVNYPTTAGVIATSCPAPMTGGTKCGASSASAAFVSKIAANGQSLIYSTYLGGNGSGAGHGGITVSAGGSGSDYGTSIAVDANDEAWVLGGTNSNNFPITGDALQVYCSPTVNSTYGEYSSCGYYYGGGYVYGATSLFIVKLNPTGTSILYGTFLGGSLGEIPAAIALDAAGNVYVAGTAAASPNGPPGTDGQYSFPTTSSAFQAQGLAGAYSGFVSELSADGHTLVYSTFFGATVGQTYGTALAVNDGKVFIGGYAQTPTLPTTPGALSSTCPGSSTQCQDNAWVAEFDPAKSGSASLVFATYLDGPTLPASGTGASNVTAMAADSSGNVYVGGSTNYPNFPTTSGVLQPTCKLIGYNCQTAFVTKLSQTGSLVWSTFYGSPSGAGGTFGIAAMALDAAGDVYFANNSAGAGDLPTKNTLYPFSGGSAIIGELSANGSQLLFGTFYGGATNVYPTGIAVDASGDIHVAGYSSGTDLPLVNAYQSTAGGGYNEGFFAKIDLQPLTSSIAVVVTPATANVGTPVKVAATVTGQSGQPTPTGTVTFKNGSTTLGTASLSSAGVGTFASTTLAAGTYSVVASYSGDSVYATSVSTAQPLTVDAPAAAPTVTLAASPTSLTVGASSTLTWSSTNATACTASGAWTGSEATGSSASETPSAAGTATYTLTCTGAGGSAHASAAVTVTAQATSSSGSGSSGSSSGGGALDWLSLAGLAGLGLAGIGRRQTR
jgi:hypothetical protein